MALCNDGHGSARRHRDLNGGGERFERQSPTLPARRFRSKFVFPVGSLFRLRVSHHLDHATFPAPAASVGSGTGARVAAEAFRPRHVSSPRHVARSVRISRTTRPICFMPRLMGPILLGRLSALPNPSFPAEALLLLSIQTY